jgi:hypothetical protein
LGFLVHHKVTRPFVENWRAQRGSEVAQRAVEENLSRVSADVRALEEGLVKIAGVQAFLATSPWEKEAVRLQEEFGTIHASETLLSAHGPELQKLLERKLPTAGLAVRFESPFQAATAPIPITSSHVPQGIREYLLELDAAPFACTPGTKLDGKFVRLPHAVIAKAPLELQAQLPSLSIGPLPEFSAEESRLLAASSDLELETQEVDGIGPEQWPDFVRARALERLQDQAKDTLASVAAAVETEVLAPLDALSSSSRFAALDTRAMTQAVSTARADLEALTTRHANLEWADTLEGKRAFVEDFKASATEALHKVGEPLGALMRSASAAHEQLDASAKKQVGELASMAEERERLRERLAKLLPSWLASLVTAEEMTLLYPFLVLAAVGFALHGAWHTRRHFLAWAPSLIASGVDPRLPAMSSVWTAVLRGPFGTTTMLGTHFAVSALALWLHWRGLQDAFEYLRGNGVDPLGLGPWLPGLALVTPLLITAGLASLLLALRRERPPSNREPLRAGAST